MLEFRFHGRGGQGVVTLSKLVARLYFQLGAHVKEFPKFGVERRGAPVEGYVRVDDRPIHVACQIYEPNVVVVMSESILDQVDVTAGLPPGALVLINSGRPPEFFSASLAGMWVATIDASAVALRHGLGTALAPIANVTLFGAFSKLMKMERDGVENAVRLELKRPGSNLEACLEAYDMATEPVLLPGTRPKTGASPGPYEKLEDLPEFAYSTPAAAGVPTGSWRSQRPRYLFKVAPCAARCPAGNDVPGFLAALAENGPTRALEILLETSPFPGVCGRVCPHPCEDECNREGLDGAVAVRAAERYAEAHAGDIEIKGRPLNHHRVAIVGAGPAGLSAAWKLQRLGHEVVVFEAAPDPGGMLLLGIPSFRLPREVLRREIERIVAIGVDLRCGVRVGVDVTLEQLREEFNAVLVAAGLMGESRLALAGGDLPGVDYGLGFLRAHNLGPEPHVGKNVVVIGGGNTAIDVAGVALRRPSTESVTIVYRRTRADMPAIPEEIGQILTEGAKLVELCGPIEVRPGEDGRVAELVCQEMELGEKDSSGRRRPVPVEGSTRTFACDHVILATGQKAELGFAPEIAVHDDGYRTDDPDVFVCGDVATGEGTVAAAIGSGRLAALAIHEALGGEPLAEPTAWAPRSGEVVRSDRINVAYFAPQPRSEAPELPIHERLTTHKEVVGEILDGCVEARRCMNCGTCSGCDNCYVFCPEPAVMRTDGRYAFDLDYCKGCGICFEECPRGVIDMVEG
ncbi:MAG: FAD-dependent oxidoreductase [Acidobacteriota bacterium]|nr:FAD-dependent oxidoreductase [Acidobacteriota bacterium]